MPCAFVIEDNVSLAYIRAYEQVSGDDIARTYEGARLHEDWQPTYRVLWNLTDVRTLDVSQPEMERFMSAAADVAGRNGAGRTAVVAARQLDASMATAYAALARRQNRLEGGPSDARDIKVFRRLQDAADWLDIPIDDLNRIHARLTN